MSKKKTGSYQTHMTEQDRHIIQNGIENGSTKSEIASVIGKDKSKVTYVLSLNSLLVFIM